MSDRQKDDDDVQEKDDTKQQGQNEEGSGSSGIHKYFGKANKNPKFFTSKSKKTIKSGQLQNLQIMLQSNLNNRKDVQKINEKTKLKCQYRWYSDFLKTKPKIKINFNPFVKKKVFQDVIMNWKKVLSKTQEENIDVKLNEKKQLNLKYKRTRFSADKKVRSKIQVETNIDNAYKFKNAVSFETMLKEPFFENYEYLNSGQLKSKIGVKDFYNLSLGKGQWKFDYSEKLTFLIRQYKVKQQSKLNFTFGQKESSQFKSNVEVTNDKNTWTIYGSVCGYKWGLDFDEAKFLYSIYGNWKCGVMLGQKSSWQLILQNPRLNRNFCTSFALYVGNKNYALILKNRFNKKQFGKLNYEVSLQNALRNTQLSKVNIGLALNFNL